MSQTPSFTDHPQSSWTRTCYGGTGTQAPVEAISVQGVGHQLPLSGMAAMAISFFGLDGSGGGGGSGGLRPIVGVMMTDAAYSVAGSDPARLLLRSGYWDDALRVLPGDAAALRAEILADRFWWRLDDAAAAEAAVAALASEDRTLARYLDAQLAYTRALFGVASRPGDAGRAREGFAVAAGDERLAGWATFWSGVLADHLDRAPGKAVPAYKDALAQAERRDDPMLESYALRHLGDHALRGGDGSGLDLLRRSYHLRAALGARPQTAAAAATLAAELPPGPEADLLRESAARTARELGLTWLLQSL